ncbi:Flagellin [Labrenzia sp. THAF82]|uniref:flagellin N-terminal helical domain-containing protein n=1 Tax=Labrenzia sp. THAF82 TaxID=2587861 RepID=UPI0012692876|nr:flagellin [Labrenzia sp. THAF82]QFT31261.1 Flagellin [Labrenzia sp. THAF82]
MGDITISSAVRTNLNSLQATSQLMSSVQERLSTGKKVNSALDNPNSFFTAQGLENRANDLSTLLDDMGQSVQNLKAADKGISAISDLVDAAKAKANQALQTSSQSERQQYASEYNELLTQIEDLAGDAGYGGKNLLGGTGNDLSVTFNEDGSSSLSITSVDYTDTTSSAGLNLSDLAAGDSGTASIALTNGTATTALTAGDTLVSDDDFTAGDTLTLTDSTGTELGSLEITASTTVQDLTDFLDDSSTDVSASFSAGSVAITADYEVTVDSDASGFTAVSTTHSTTNGFSSDSKIESTLDSLTSAQNTLRSQASTFGTNLSIVENRQDFTKSLINTLEEGAGKLTLADTNEEGANLLALQTQQTLASTSLSLAAQADQNVLRLF